MSSRGCPSHLCALIQINKKRRPLRGAFIRQNDKRKSCLASDEVSLLQTTRANVNLCFLSVLQHGDFLDIGLKFAVGNAVGVADGMTSNRVLSADITYF